jgi:hypothetical protein
VAGAFQRLAGRLRERGGEAVRAGMGMHQQDTHSGLLVRAVTRAQRTLWDTP